METAKCEQCGEIYPVDIGCVTCRLAGKSGAAEKEASKEASEKEE